MKWKRIWISLWLLTLLAIFIVTLINRTPYFLLGGSSSVAPLMEELLNKYPDNHKNGDFNYVSSASAGALPRVEKNLFGIGWISEEYQVDKTINPDLIDFQIMRDGLIMVYNIPNEFLISPEEPLDFNTEVVQNLYIKKKTQKTTWDAIFPEKIKKGSNLEVKTFTRPNGSGTRNVFDNLALKDTRYYEANTADSSGAMLNLDVGSVGYTSFADFHQGKNISVKAGTWMNEPATYESIATNLYKIWRPFTGIINKTYKYQSEITKLLKWLFSTDETVNEIFMKYGPKIKLDDEVNQDLKAWLR